MEDEYGGSRIMEIYGDTRLNCAKESAESFGRKEILFWTWWRIQGDVSEAGWSQCEMNANG